MHIGKHIKRHEAYLRPFHTALGMHSLPGCLICTKIATVTLMARRMRLALSKRALDNAVGIFSLGFLSRNHIVERVEILGYFCCRNLGVVKCL